MAGKGHAMSTPLLELKNIGKIYVSENNVTVGIRGVNLAFEKGEFVAITGRSGSGKSTLLNVISGMDSYEEGELFVEGEPTSHYLQKDWEAYRKEYISFIFQEYNIIESFTVLQNVELALMNIEDTRRRREKALELLRRVGLEKHIHHKGSKLSGGQKQRTVIARALAKDSPIILADEPTGNLDSQSSKEIIELLREVSRDKLVIVVTHNFEQVEAHATRHIRIFDGAVDLNHTIRPPQPLSPQTEQAPLPVMSGIRRRLAMLRNGLHLGRVRFSSMPKLSIFLCVLMTLTALIITMISTMSSNASMLFEEKTMFTHIPGRMVIVREDGGIITDDELQKLASEIGAKDFMHYDNMLDNDVGVSFESPTHYQHFRFTFGYPAASVGLDGGRYPEKVDEVILEVPISMETFFGKGSAFQEYTLPRVFDLAQYRVVGVKYYYDNTRTPRMLFTDEGYRVASALVFFADQQHNFQTNYMVSRPDGSYSSAGGSNGRSLIVDFDMAPRTFFVNVPDIKTVEYANGEQAFIPREQLKMELTLTGTFTNYRYEYWTVANGAREIIAETKPGYGEKDLIEFRISDHYTHIWRLPAATEARLSLEWGTSFQDGMTVSHSFAVISPDILLDFMYEHYYEEAYTQASLFFKNDREAHKMAEALRERGYIAVVSDETVELEVTELISNRLLGLMSAIGWLGTVIFAGIFLSLCSSRAMNATKGDIAIMRSMGIPTAVVRISIYVQILIALIPAALVTAATCITIYTIPKTNYIFTFLHAREYLVIALVLILVALNLSRLHVKRMFSESVKKTLKGGNKQ